MSRYVLLALGVALSATAIQAQAPANPYADAPVPTNAQVIDTCERQYSIWHDPGFVGEQALTFRVPSQAEFKTMCTCMATELKAMGQQAGPIFAALTDQNYRGGGWNRRDFRLGVLRYRGAIRLPDGTWTHKGASPDAQAAKQFWDRQVLLGMDPEQAAMARSSATDLDPINYGDESTRQRITYTQYYEKARECRPADMTARGFEHMDSYGFFIKRQYADADSIKWDGGR